MRRLLRPAAGLLALALLGAVMAWLAGLFSPTIPPGQGLGAEAPAALDTIPVRGVTEPVIEQVPGTVRARNETVVSSRITATIRAVTVRAGDRVAAGDLLVQLDSRALQARVEQQRESAAAAEARLAEVESRYQRVRSLLQRGVVAQAEMDRAEADLRSARADLARAREAIAEATTELSYASIRAPIDGRITDRFADPGDTAVPGAPLLRLYDPASLRLEADVRESLTSGLALGQGLNARVDALGREFRVTVDEIVPSAEPGTRTFRVKAALPPTEDLYPGMFGRLLIPTGERRRLYVPGEAVFRLGQLEFVRVAVDGHAVRRYVRTGSRTADGQVEVLSGLQEGERVVVGGG